LRRVAVIMSPVPIVFVVVVDIPKPNLCMSPYRNLEIRPAIRGEAPNGKDVRLGASFGFDPYLAKVETISVGSLGANVVLPGQTLSPGLSASPSLNRNQVALRNGNLRILSERLANVRPYN
jgi:hypothetical protein